MRSCAVIQINSINNTHYHFFLFTFLFLTPRVSDKYDKLILKDKLITEIIKKKLPQNLVDNF